MAIERRPPWSWVQNSWAHIGRVIAAALIGAALLPAAAQAGSMTIHNYGFRVTVPDWYTLCLFQPAGSAHGIGVLLDGRSCDSTDDGPYVEIEAGYNTAAEAIMPYGIARSGCASIKGRLGTKPVWIAGFPFYRCTGGSFVHDTSFITLIASHDPLATDWKDMWISMHCPNRPCDKKAVAQVLKGLTIRRGSWDGD